MSRYEDTDCIYWSVEFRLSFLVPVKVKIMVKIMVLVKFMGKVKFMVKVKDMDNMIPIVYTGALNTESDSWTLSLSWSWTRSRSLSWTGSWSLSWSWSWSGEIQ